MPCYTPLSVLGNPSATVHPHSPSLWLSSSMIKFVSPTTSYSSVTLTLSSTVWLCLRFILMSFLRWSNRWIIFTSVNDFWVIFIGVVVFFVAKVVGVFSSRRLFNLFGILLSVFVVYWWWVISIVFIFIIVISIVVVVAAN